MKFMKCKVKGIETYWKQWNNSPICLAIVQQKKKKKKEKSKRNNLVHLTSYIKWLFKQRLLFCSNKISFLSHSLAEDKIDFELKSHANWKPLLMPEDWCYLRSKQLQA